MNKELVPNSLIGEDAEFYGKFIVKGSFRIDGYYEGELSVDDHLYISPIGRLKTDVLYTKTIAVGGILMGDIEASDEVHLLSTGRVLGNIKTPKLVVEPGVVVQGTIDITGIGGVKNLKEEVKDMMNDKKSTSSKKTSPKKKEVELAEDNVETSSELPSELSAE